jgi:hypothetical protein
MSVKHRIPPGHRAPIATTIALIEREVPDGMRLAALRVASLGARVMYGRRSDDGIAIMSIMSTQPVEPLTYCAGVASLLRAHGYTVLPQEQISEVGAGGRIHVRLEYDAGDDTLGILILGLDDNNLLPPVTMLLRATDLAAWS